MTATALIKLAGTLATFVILSWTLTAVAIQVIKQFGRNVPPLYRHVYHELRPFYLPAVVVAPVAHSMLVTTSAWTWISLAVNLWNWWSLRNVDDDDDDRWKRRRQRLAEQVSVVGGRLAVVPAGAS